MTANRDLKKLIRERMGRTGERYTTARAILLATRARGAGRAPGWDGLVFPSVEGVGGQQPDLAAARNFCAANGVTGPDDGPLSEAMVFGLAGGVGFLHGSFAYGEERTMTLAARNEPMPDPMVDALLRRLALGVEVACTSGAKKAAAGLDRVVATERPALVTVASNGLPHLGPVDSSMPAPHVVGVVGGDDANHTLLLDDRAPEPIRIDRLVLDQARGGYRQAKHRLVTATGGWVPIADWPELLERVVAENAESFETPPVPQFAANVGTAGLDRWASLLRASSARSWSRLFDSGQRAAVALTRTCECVDHAYTAEAAGRPLYAEFLREAAAVTGLASWSQAAEHLDESAEAWRGVVAIARAADPAVDTHAALSQRRSEVLDDGGEPGAMTELARQQAELVSGCRISADKASEAYRAMADVVDRIAEAERSMTTLLGADGST